MRVTGCLETIIVSRYGLGRALAQFLWTFLSSASCVGLVLRQASLFGYWDNRLNCSHPAGGRCLPWPWGRNLSCQ